jgi:hypothetical protein
MGKKPFHGKREDEKRHASTHYLSQQDEARMPAERKKK